MAAKIYSNFHSAFTAFQNWTLFKPECKASYFAAVKIQHRQREPTNCPYSSRSIPVETGRALVARFA